MIEKLAEGYFIHQKPYIQDLLKKHKLDERNATKIILDRETDEEERAFEREQQEDWYKTWITTEEYYQKMKESQRIAG